MGVSVQVLDQESHNHRPAGTYDQPIAPLRPLRADQHGCNSDGPSPTKDTEWAMILATCIAISRLSVKRVHRVHDLLPVLLRN
jgi:hypothetical protein